MYVFHNNRFFPFFFLIRVNDIKKSAEQLENDIEVLNKETFEADYYIRELEKILQKENLRNLKIQKDVENLTKDILLSSQEIKKLKAQEKYLDNETKVRNMKAIKSSLCISS